MSKNEEKQTNFSETPNEDVELAFAVDELSKEKTTKKAEAPILEAMDMTEDIDIDVTKGNDEVKQVDSDSSIQKKIKDNETVTQATTVTKNYFTWLLETLKHPITKAGNYNQLYPWITIGLISLFISISITFYLRGIYDKAMSIGPSFINAFTYSSNYEVSNPFGLGIFIGLFVCFAILMITLIFATWVGLKVMGSRLTFTNVVDQYASLYVPVVVLIVLSSILTLITLRVIGMLVLLLALMILFISWYFIIFNAKNERNLDDFYAKLLALLCGGAILGAIYFILLFSIITKLITSIPSLF